MQNFNRATKYLQNGNVEKALQFYKRQLKEHEFKELYLNMGNCYRLLGKDKDSYNSYLKSSDHSTPFADGTFGVYPHALSNLGLLEYTWGNDDAAIIQYTAALDKDPIHLDSIWNYSNAYLRKLCSLEEVDVEAAWKMYEYRFNRTTPTHVDRDIQRWDGVSKGKSIIVVAEQGFGDKIMFGRYIHCLREYFSEVWVQCPIEMKDIFSDYKTCQVSLDSNAEVAVPYCSLASVFKNVRSDWLAGKFGTKKFTSGFNIGIEWAGSATHSNNKYRSVLPTYFLDLAKYGNLYSIRPGAPAVRGVKALNSSSWAESAEIVNGLDLIISVDTSLVHLAGSLGKECWMLQPLKETDFRWGNNTMVEDNIWYPSVKVIRNPGSWPRVFERVCEKLDIMQLREYKNKMQGMIGDMNAFSIQR